MSEVDRLEGELATLRALPTPIRQDRKPVEDLVTELVARMMSESEEMRDAIRPTVNVHPPAVRVETMPSPEVRVDVPDTSPALEAVAGQLGRIADALEQLCNREMSVNVDVPAPVVNVTIPDEPERKVVSVERNQQGFITGLTVEDQE